MSRLCSANKKGEPKGGSPRPGSPSAMGLGGVHCLEFLKNNHTWFEFLAIILKVVVGSIKNHIDRLLLSVGAVLQDTV